MSEIQAGPCTNSSGATDVDFDQAGEAALGSPEGGTFYRRCMLRAASRWNFTPRQAQVLAKVVKGASNKDIALLDDCAENTIELHMTNIMRKARVSSRAELIALFWCGESWQLACNAIRRAAYPAVNHSAHQVA